MYVQTPESCSHSHTRFLCAHFNAEFNMCMYRHDSVISQLLWGPIVVQYVTYTCVMWKLVCVMLLNIFGGEVVNLQNISICNAAEWKYQISQNGIIKKSTFQCSTRVAVLLISGSHVIDPDHMWSTSCSSKADVKTKARQLWAIVVWSVGVYFQWHILTKMLLYQNDPKAALLFPLGKKFKTHALSNLQMALITPSKYATVRENSAHCSWLELI